MLACRCSCTSKSQCLDAHVDNRWLSYDAWECIRVPPQFVNPARIAVTSRVQVRHTLLLSDAVACVAKLQFILDWLRRVECRSRHVTGHFNGRVNPGS